MSTTKRHIRILLLLAAALTLLLTGCERVDGPTPRPETQEEIRLDAAVWQMMQGAPSRRVSTYDNAAALQAGTFKTYAYEDGSTDLYIDGSTVSYFTDHWEFNDGKHYWPLMGALNFFCHMPADLANTYCTFDKTAYADPGNLDGYSEDCPRIVCADLPVTITRGSDATRELIVAYTAEQDRAGTNSTLQPNAGKVALSFMHPFARVRFKLSAESATSVVVNSITIPAIYRDGLCTFNGAAQTFTWSALDDNDEGLVISAPSAGEQATDDDAFYLVIPNDYDTKTLFVDVTWTEWGEVHNQIYSNPLAINWTAGYSYTYNFTITRNELIVDIEKYTEQW